MSVTHAGITYGGKQLDCELSYTAPTLRIRPPFIPDDYDFAFTLEKVSLACVVHSKSGLDFDITHIEDITSLIEGTPIWEGIEERAINAIMERGYV